MNKVILITSGKGGTGKTMFAVNLGAALANAGKRVALIDMDLGMRNMDLYLGMENRVVFNIMDVMTGICRLNKALLKVHGFDSLYFMAASPRRSDKVLKGSHMDALCRLLEKYFDHIIIDTGAGINDILDASAAAAGRAVIVTEPEIAALRDADTMVSYLNGQGLTDVCMVLNKADMELMRAGILPDVQSIINDTSTPVDGIIWEDRNIRISTSRGVPIVTKEDSGLGETFLQIAQRILGETERTY